MSLILRQETASSIPTPDPGKGTVFLNTSDQLTVKDSSGSLATIPTFTATNNTSVFFNDDGGLGESANLTFVKTTNTLSVSGNVVAGGVKTDNLYYANGNPWDLQQPAGSNTAIQFNDNDSFGGSANFVWNNSTNTLSVTGTSNVTGVLNVTGNASAGNINAGNLLTANFVTGTLTTSAQPNITSVGTLTDLAMGGNIIPNANITYSLGNSTNRFKDLYLASSTIYLGNVNLSATGDDFSIGGNAVVGGNLTVNGNVTYINVETFDVEDPIISVGGGPNGAPLTSNDGKDRGLLMHYYTSAPVDAFMGWDNGNGEFAFGSNVSVASDVITYNSLGNVRAGNFLGALTGDVTGNVSGMTANLTGNISAGNANLGNLATAVYFTGTLTTAYQPNITGVGVLTTLEVGATADKANDFPNAKTVSSQDNTGDGLSAHIGLVGEGVADSIQPLQGFGLYGVARANGAGKGTGVQGTALVTNTADTGAAVGVRGYATDTHSGGYNIGVLGNAIGSGVGNYAFYVQNGGIASIENATFWDLTDNSNAALTFNSTGKANIFGIETTDNAEGIFTSGYLNVVGNVSAGGVKTNNLYYANGTPWDLQQAGGSNTQVQFNDGDNFGGSAAFTFDKTSNLVSMGGALSVTGNANVGNIGAAAGVFTGNVSAGNVAGGNLVSANYVSGTLTTAAQPNITSVGTLTSLSVTGNVSAGNVSGTLLTGTLTTAAQPNVTSVGTLTSLSVTGNVSAGNVSATDISGTTLGGTLTTAAQPNITSVGTLTSAAVTGNVTAGNVYANSGTIGANLLTGTLTTASQPNVTSLGTLTSLDVSGNIDASNIDAGNLLTANYVAGTLTTAAQPNITSVGTLTSLSVTGNASAGNLDAVGKVVASTLESNVATGTAPFVVASTTKVANLNVDLVDGFHTDQATSSNTIVVRNVDGNIIATNASLGNLVTANYVSGTLTTAAQPNITSVGTLTSLAVTGNVSAGNVNATDVTGTTLGGTLTTAAQPNITSVGTLTSLDVAGNVNAGNVSGTLLTGTLTTAAQPNVTSVGTLTSLTVTGNVSAGNVSGTLLTGTLTTAAQPNITSVGTLTSLGVTGNISGANLIANTKVITDDITNKSGNLVITTNSNVVFSTTGTIDAGNVRVINVATPSSDADAATKAYVDNLVSSGIHYHQPVRVESPIALNATYNNGSNGVGATLTNAGTNVAIVIDGISLNTSDRVLVYQQANAVHNGVYVVSTVGDGSTAWVLTRASDADTYAPSSDNGLDEGSYFFVQEGNTGAGESYVVSTVGTITFGTTPINFAQFSKAPIYTAGTGLTLSTEQFSISNTTVTAGSYGNGDRVATFTVNSQGQLTAAANTAITANAANLTGTTLASSIVNSSLTSVGTLGSLSVTGNVSAGNVSGTLLTGTLTTASQPNITSVGTLTGLTVTGNVSAGNVSGTLLTGTLTTASQPNVTSVGTLTSLSVTGNANVGNIGAEAGVFTTVTGSLITASQPNVTSVGTLTGLGVNGNITAANITANTGVFTGNGSGLTNLNASNISSGTLAQARLANSSLTVNGVSITLGSSGTITANTTQTLTRGTYLTGSDFNGGTATTWAVDATDAATASKVVARDANGSFAGNVITATTFSGSGASLTTLNASNISSGTLAQARLANSSLTVNGTAISLGGSGTITANTTQTLTLGSYFIESGTTFNGGSPVTLAVDATTTNTAGKVVARDGSGNFSAGTITATLSGAATTAGTVTTAAQPNITSVGTLTSLAVSGALTTTNITTGANTTAGSITGNWTLTAGSRFNATYADLAERYVADAQYEPGTVLIFGGEHEVTALGTGDSTRVAGVVTTNPAYLMNSECEGEHVVDIALIGRVPVKVQGPVRKGDLLVSSEQPGFAKVNNEARAGTIIGKALQNYNGPTPDGVVEAMVGRC